MLKRFTTDESGLTLIEILIVILILGVLASTIAPRVMNAPDKAKVATAKNHIISLEQALQLYSLNVGDYPTTDQGLQALWKAPNPTPPNWEPTVQKAMFTDPWGRDYVYMYPGTHEGYPYDLYSRGKDGKEGGDPPFNADITSWVEETE
jgi:general secretion pathway protein G